MPSTRPTRPETFDIIPADEVGALIEATDRDFVDLERRALEASHAAEEAEAAANEAGIDPKAATWSMVRLQRFLDTLRDEALRDAAATVGVARHRAKVRIDDARASADGGGTLYSRSAAAWAPPPPPPPLAQDQPSESPGSSRHQTLVVPVAREAPPAPTNGSGHSGNATGSTIVAAVVAAPPVVLAQPLVEEAPVLDEHFWVSEPTNTIVSRRAPAVTADPAPPVVAEATTSPPPLPPSTAPAPKTAPQKRSVLKRVPVSAILEVIAVVLILVFILLRLS